MSEKKYIVIGGYVTSKSDGDRHYVSPEQLCHLYNVNPEECYLTTEKIEASRKFRGLPKLPILSPRYDGNYNL